MKLKIKFTGKILESWLNQIEKIVAQIALNQGCELYDLEFIGTGQGRTLRIFIDKEGGIGIEDCSNVSKGLNEVLEAREEIIPGGAYHLEVSSPGLDRVLKTKSHFEKVIGKKVYIQLMQNLGSLGAQEKSIQAMKKFEEELLSVIENNLVFKFKNEEVHVPMDKVDKAKLVFDMKQNLKKRP